MPRPLRNGIDYFSMDVDFLQDRKIKLIKAEFGVRGVIVVLSAFCLIYRENGYWAPFDEEDEYLLSDEIGDNCTPGLVREVIQGCCRRSIFDDGVFKAFHVLTSRGIQRRFIRAAAKRDEIRIVSDYWLLDLGDVNDVSATIKNKLTFRNLDDAEKCTRAELIPPETPHVCTEKNNSARNPSQVHTCGVNSTGNPTRMYSSGVNSDFGTQSKVKESKVKESNLVVVGGEGPGADGQQQQPDVSFPSVSEVREFCEQRGNNIDAEYFIDYYQSSGWKIRGEPIRDWRAVIRVWERQPPNKDDARRKNQIAPERDPAINPFEDCGRRG